MLITRARAKPKQPGRAELISLKFTSNTPKQTTRPGISRGFLCAPEGWTMQRFYILAWVAILLLSCNLTTGATLGAPVLKTPTQTPTETHTTPHSPTPRPERCTVTAYHLNIRAGAGTAYAVIGTLDQGQAVTVIERGAWYQVQTETGAAGYIYSKYCKIGEIRK